MEFDKVACLHRKAIYNKQNYDRRLWGSVLPYMNHLKFYAHVIHPYDKSIKDMNSINDEVKEICSCFGVGA